MLLWRLVITQRWHLLKHSQAMGTQLPAAPALQDVYHTVYASVALHWPWWTSAFTCQSVGILSIGLIPARKWGLPLPSYQCCRNIGCSFSTTPLIPVVINESQHAPFHAQLVPMDVDHIPNSQDAPYSHPPPTRDTWSPCNPCLISFPPTQSALWSPFLSLLFPLSPSRMLSQANLQWMITHTRSPLWYCITVLTSSVPPRVHHGYGVSHGVTVTGVTGAGAVLDFAPPQHTATCTAVSTVVPCQVFSFLPGFSHCQIVRLTMCTVTTWLISSH